MSAEEILKKFDRYFLLDRIAQGGMAEIYRARPATLDGGGRFLVIKRIQAGFGENNEFHSMFRSEIKVTMGFNHPNIVQLYDYGETEGQPFIAMELVDGKTLRQFINGLAKRGETLPIELAAYVAEQAAAGLQYAHAFKDKITGEPLQIVHRDISPQNILVSYDGAVKIIDFGIAKATTNVESTKVGVIKGKPSYLSPEQVAGEALDGRSDLFALGVVLWESLTGKKLFSATGENEFAVLKLIESAQTHVKPPSTLNPNVPRELDQIVMRALAKDRAARFQSADEMQRALRRFIAAFAPEFSPADLAYCAKTLFKDDIIEDRKRLQRLSGKAEQLLRASAAIDTAPPPAPPAMAGEGTPPPAPEVVEGTRSITGLAGDADSSGSLDRELTQQDKGTQVSLEVKVRGTETAIFAAEGRVTGPAPSRAPGAARPMPYSSTRGARRADAKPARSWIAAAAAVAVTVYTLFELGLLDGKAPVSRDPARRAAPPTETAASAGGAERADAALEGTLLLHLAVFPGWGDARVTLNGKPVLETNPAVRVRLDEALEVSVEKEGFRPFRREFVLSSAELRGVPDKLMTLPLEPVRFGYLSLSTTPSADAYIRPVDSENRAIAATSNDAPWVIATPIKNEKLPVGTYNVRLVNKLLGMEREIVVQIHEGKAVTREERLE